MKTVRIPDRAAPAPAERGETVLALSALEKLTARVAAEVDRVEGVPAGGLRRLTGRGGGRSVDARVEVDGSETTVSLSVAFPYPESVREMSDRLRAGVIERVGRLTELDVVAVDITVDEFWGDDADQAPGSLA